ncbi:MAG: hypothetical protein ACYDDA_00570 [Acidiferrobacteraceae bacterium]
MDDQHDNDRSLAEAHELLGLWRSAKDSLSDDVVNRLGTLVTESMDLLDRANRADLGRMIPVLRALLDNGDLDRMAGLARLVGSAQDALSDDVVARLGTLISEGLMLVERLLQTGVGDAVFGALAEARTEQAGGPRARGGIGGLWEILKTPEAQETLRFFVLFGSHLRRRLEA